MLEAKQVGEWMQQRGLMMVVTPGIKDFTIEFRLTPQAAALLNQYGCKDEIIAIPAIKDEDFEVALKVAMHLYDRDPNAGMPSSLEESNK